MKKIVAVSVVGFSLLLLGGLSGCADVSPNTYSAGDVGQVNQVVPAKIISMRPVKINASSGGVGTLVGAGVGAVAGSAIGGGTRANLLGGIGGALVGGLAGHAIEKGISTKQGMEYVLRTKSGKLLTVTQTQDLLLGVGQKVLIIYGRQTKIVPDNTGA